ncbi:TonB-dependent receptor [Lunatimonas salinarum]|uniref:TonB-dependent receptor n=1 Tax=Lunatimonas salinarum TaxID=1774590 RepID=UPI001AE06BE0|nr:TonB-dependent receptor [Lunatimonas salinarum]
MKLIGTFLFLVLAIDVNGQDNIIIQLPQQEYRISDLLKLISDQAQHSFIYQSSDIQTERIVTTPEERYELRALLSVVFPSQTHEYQIRDGKILVKRKKDVNHVGNQRFTVSGYVTDSTSSESLIGAHIYFPELNSGVVTNAYGYFSASLPPGSYTINVGYLGYARYEQSLNLSEEIKLDIALIQRASTLAEVDVYAGQSLVETSQISSLKIPVRQMSNLPVLLGETDLMKSIQLLPGVSGGLEGFSNFYVRGGGPDQNLILLDGVPLYNTQHLFGFLSTFNNDALNNVDLYKGGFPARYGGRLSSVLDIQMKEGNRQEFRGDATVGLLASAITLEGPINEQSSFMVSGRRTYWDVLARPILESMNQDIGYHFYDLYAKINHTLSDTDKIYFSIYLGNDKLTLMNDDLTENSSQIVTNEERNNLKWGNFISAFRWNHTYNSKLFSNVGITYSRFNYDIHNSYIRTFKAVAGNTPEPEIYSNSLNSGIEDVTIKADFDFFPVPKHTIKFGSLLTYHTFTPKALSTNNFNTAISLFTEPISAVETASYLEDDFKLGSRFDINIGAHLSSFSLPAKTYTSIQPRVSMNYRLGDKLSTKLAYAKMTQFLQLLTTSTIGLPSDLWVPTTEKIPPQDAYQVTAGVAYIPAPNLEFSLEGYYKKMDNLLEYKEGVNYAAINTDWQETVTSAEGRSYGVELLAQKKAGKFDGFMGYTLAWTFRNSPDLNLGKEYFYRFDRRHDLSLAINFNKSTRMVYSGVWVFGTGQAVTLPEVQYFNPNNQLIVVFSERGAYRMPTYHRMDFSASLIKEKKKGERRWVFGIYNIYARRNPVFLEYIPGVDAGFVQYSLFQLIPSISYKRSF